MLGFLLCIVWADDSDDFTKVKLQRRTKKTKSLSQFFIVDLNKFKTIQLGLRALFLLV